MLHRPPADRGEGSDEGASPRSRRHERRRGEQSALGLACLVSLVLTQLLLMPATYLLLRTPEVVAEPVEIEISLLPPPALPDTQRDPDAIDSLAPPPTPRERPPTAQPPEKPAPRPPDPPQEPRPPLDIPRLKMVEVQNPESQRAPEDARYLSDKNRRVAVETRARLTNLVRDDPKLQPKSEAQQPRDDKAGAQQPRIAETQKLDAPTKKSQPPPRRKQRAQLAMRSTAPQHRHLTPLSTHEHGTTASARRASERSLAPRPQLDASHEDFERIYGETAAIDREIARLNPSTPRGGRTANKVQRVLSALENFVPEVQPGNQTALGTRAHPFALYIARMHRRIHKLWGFGFLIDLDRKADGHPMNDMDLWTAVELVINPQGRISKATLLRPSGVLAFDAAALDTVYTAAPYPPTPRAIRSANGNVYLHWRFHRNHRQCGTFGVDPFLLTTPPEGPIDVDVAEVKGTEAGAAPRRSRRPLPDRFSRRRKARYPLLPARAPSNKQEQQQQESAKRAAHQVVSASDPKALRSAERFVQGFADGDANAMAEACAVPFASAGKVVAKSRQELTRMFHALIEEAEGRSVSAVALMSVMQARARLSRLPRGAEHGAGMLVGLVRLGEAPVTLLLRRHEHGHWRIIGLNR